MRKFNVDELTEMYTSVYNTDQIALDALMDFT